MGNPNLIDSKASPVWIAATAFLVFTLILFLYVFDSFFTNEYELTSKDNIGLIITAQELEQMSMEYQKWTFQETIEHHEWNLRSTKYIFWISMLVTIVGITFSFWQFAQASHFDTERESVDEIEVKNHLSSVSFKSRSIASFVLVLSLFYLFIYVKFLYPISYLPPIQGSRGFSSVSSVTDVSDSAEKASQTTSSATPRASVLINTKSSRSDNNDTDTE